MWNFPLSTQYIMLGRSNVLNSKEQKQNQNQNISSILIQKYTEISLKTFFSVNLKTKYTTMYLVVILYISN